MTDPVSPADQLEHVLREGPRLDESGTGTGLPIAYGLGNRQKRAAGGNAAMRQPDRIICPDTIRFRTGLSRSTIYRKIVEARSPPRSR